MSHLKDLSHIHGGKYTLQSGIVSGSTRDYWLIMEAFHPISPGWVRRSAQIERSWGMEVFRANGTRRTHSSHSFYSLVYIYDGEGQYWDDNHDGPIPVKTGDVICVFPRIAHVYVPLPGTRWNEININFSGSAFDTWMGAGLLDPEYPVRRLPLEEGKTEYWLKRFHDVVLPIAGIGRDSTLLDTGRMLSLLSELCESWQTPRQSADIQWAEEAKGALISIPLVDSLDLNDVASGFGLGEQAFRKKFKRLCGVTPTVFRSRYLVEQACYRLIASNNPIKEIAYELGFGSQPYFSRRFKQITGMSPEEYRMRAEH